MQKFTVDLLTLSELYNDIRVNTAGLKLTISGTLSADITDADAMAILTDINKINVDVIIKGTNESIDIYNDIQLGQLIELSMFQNARIDMNYTLKAFTINCFLPLSAGGYIAVGAGRFIQVKLTKSSAAYSKQYSTLSMDMRTVASYQRGKECLNVVRKTLTANELTNFDFAGNPQYMCVPHNLVKILRLKAENQEVEFDKDVLMHLSDYVSDDFIKLNGRILAPTQNSYIQLPGAYGAIAEMSANSTIYLIGKKKFEL